MKKGLKAAVVLAAAAFLAAGKASAEVGIVVEPLECRPVSVDWGKVEARIALSEAAAKISAATEAGDNAAAEKGLKELFSGASRTEAAAPVLLAAAPVSKPQVHAAKRAAPAVSPAVPAVPAKAAHVKSVVPALKSADGTFAGADIPNVDVPLPADPSAADGDAGAVSDDSDSDSGPSWTDTVNDFPGIYGARDSKPSSSRVNDAVAGLVLAVVILAGLIVLFPPAALLVF